MPTFGAEDEAQDMTGYAATRQDRIIGAGGAAALVGLIGYGLVMGLGVDFQRRIADDLTVISVLPESPPPKPDPVPAREKAEKRKEGAAAPPNLKSKATEIVAPPPPIVLRQPPPVVVAPIAGVGFERSTGAAPVAGPGTGSGGQGNGTGSGDAGDGDGGGGGTDAELISNELRYRDLPRDIYDSQAAGMVTYHATIGVDGRLSDCRVVKSSGNRALDAATCALALKDVRFRPARDASGRKVADAALFEQEWTVTRDPDRASDEEGRR
ncbi:TonB family protein [Sphingomonas sp. RB3P16]|uniref:energy transducer TonB n=1 Tax=Parasphingomonas frigoris TaxID=3096163 RepID=UPI002FC5CEF6